MNIFRKKSIAGLLIMSNKSTMKRELGALDLTMLGIGATIGTGIFVLTGIGALAAGPAFIISCILAGIACLLAAFTYAEFASTVPVSGSVYTYTYATMGEFLAWMIGWDIIMEYLLTVSAVSVGWSGYFVNLLNGLGLKLPIFLTAAPGTIAGMTTYINLPAFVIVLLVTGLLSVGVKEAKWLNNIMVVIKVAVILLVIVVGFFYVKPVNWTPFAPTGLSGIFSAAAIIFFAFLGFDALATAAEETKNPSRDLPRGIIASLGICTVLYVAFVAVLTGIINYKQFSGYESYPVAHALSLIKVNWADKLVSIGAIAGMVTVILVMLYGLTRVVFAMSRDGLLPAFFSKMHPKFVTPFASTWFFGILASVIGGLVPLAVLAQLVNLGTLAAFALISLAVIILRHNQPDLPRKFRCPGVPYIPLTSILLSGYFMIKLDLATWIAFCIWIVIGAICYFIYSYHHSNFDQHELDNQVVT